MTVRVGILVDTTRCTGCEKCVKACKDANELGKDLPRPWKARIDDLSSTRYTTILRRAGGHNVRQLCRHCYEPACVSACIVGALQKTAEGPVIYDAGKCMGCRYCMMACPFGIPRYDWEDAVPHVAKCTMCYPRLGEGKLPACVEACPENAVTFGPLEDLLAEAHRRIAADPRKYVDKVYGETEIGGTSVVYVSDIPLDFLAFKPDLGDKPLPELTWSALSKVPPIVLTMGSLMTGIYWIIERRMKLADENGPRPEPNPEEEKGDQA
jgi:formate dehydrogenase iron-sulfur subunit